VHAFFQGRGFPPEVTARLVADGCVFRSAIGNARDGAGDPAIEIDLHHWRLDQGGGWRAIRIKDAWLAEFAGHGVPEPARIAFRWATFPTRQAYGPSDYNWGIFAFALPAGTKFDLQMRWTEAGAAKSGVLRGLTCAAPEAGG